jgi:predicted PurR-regulated permease PerM
MSNARSWLIGAAVVAGAVLIWDVLSGALSALLLLFTAMLIAAGLRPIVDRMSKRMPYGAAVGLAFVAVIAVLVVIGAVLIQPLGAELI